MGIVLIWSFFSLCLVWCAWCAVATTGNKRLNERIKVENVPVLFRSNISNQIMVRNMCDSFSLFEQNQLRSKTRKKPHKSNAIHYLRRNSEVPDFGIASQKTEHLFFAWIISIHFTKFCQHSAVAYSRHFRLVSMKYDRSRFQYYNTNIHA